jgi:hypothetical protein
MFASPKGLDSERFMGRARGAEVNHVYTLTQFFE